jgi:hypothetical protein
MPLIKGVAVQLLPDIHLHKPNEIADVVVKCEKWWLENCLYLDPKPRSSFISACHQAVFYNTLPHDDGSRKRIFDEIVGVSKDLEIAVGLPTIGREVLEKARKGSASPVSRG